MKKNWGFDIRDIDKSIRPQDDFFHYASGNWMKKNPIPKNESRWGAFTTLRHSTEEQLRILLKKTTEKNGQKTESPEKIIGDFYNSGVNLKHRKKINLAPLKEILNKIENIKNPTDIIRTISYFGRIGSACVWNTYIDPDIKNNVRYIIYLAQGGLGMPDRDYYLDKNKESKRVREAYKKHLVRLLELAGRGKNAKKDAETVFKIETALAKASMKKEELRDVDKTYYKKSFNQLQKFAPKINWKEYFKIFGSEPKEIVIMQPEFFVAVGQMLSSYTIEKWKAYFFAHIIADFASFLTPELEKEIFNFYGTTLTGTKHMKPIWRRVLGIVNAGLGELFGKLYVKEYFPPEAKRKVSTVVDNLFSAYETRIKNLDWMNSSTKKKAIKKLQKMQRKLGYPDRWKSYRGLCIHGDDYVGNIMRINEYEHRRALRKLKKPVDRKEWHMSPQTVNAYCNFLTNDIVFPAAILQHPFFDFTADDAFNYGAIGSVIGHEITHGFDDQGSKFDEKGNRKTWWTKVDRSHFDKKSKRLVDEFNGYKVESGLRVNGKLTLGENIADLGGISIAYDAYQLQLSKTVRKNIDGFTPEQRFFLGYAATEREQERPEFRKMQIMTDPHSPSIFRVNGPLSNLPEFYEAFGVKKGDKLYREPQHRAKIW